MYQTQSYVYSLQYNGKPFDYYSVFDNNLINYTYGRASTDRDKISTMNINLLETIPPNHWINSTMLPLITFCKNQDYKGDYLFVDFSNAGSHFNHIEEDLAVLVSRYKVVYFYKIGQSTTQDMKKVFTKIACIFSEINNDLSYATKDQDNYISLFDDETDVVKKIDNCLSKLIFEKIAPEEKTIENVYSSNIFSNHYINVRNLFADGKLAALATTRLLHMIMNTTDLDFDAFVCASITGACLASYLSVYIKKPVLFLRNIGPDITTDDDLIVERIYPHKKYVYIFDFMCLGTEYQRMKLICSLKKSSIIHSFGISHYKKPNQGRTDQPDEVSKLDDIQTLFDINGFKQNYYACSVERTDLEDKKEQ
ncbi:hypothetical protein [Aristaeella hokkaidonensis]|uniref:Uncharacterized protein n=1 Tax=Aristaeella hokkaidonensis TaxID=3046382 RepID=A0AC61MV76_9FIRM|nr:hypothetical protein [Aristaeella hokkaidonensis]QUC66357.1 hypothetical protein JYE49_10865 [Aristaeella hokkaidonensis]SNT94232.1 hypothetical protein SAMN06297421_104205 [Aristaeella hokkaidonensis]